MPASCEKGKTKWIFCFGGNEILGKILRATNGNPTTIESKIGGLEVEFKCTGGTFEPTLKGEGELTGTDQFTGCTAPRPGGTCTIGGKAITTEQLTGKMEGTGPPEIELKNATKIAVITIEGCKALEGKYTLTGSQICRFDKGYETEQTEHELICEKTGSKLKLEAEAASLAVTAKGPLLEGGNWSMLLI